MGRNRRGSFEVRVLQAAVRGAQETLGFDSPSHMKGLQARRGRDLGKQRLVLLAQPRTAGTAVMAGLHCRHPQLPDQRARADTSGQGLGTGTAGTPTPRPHGCSRRSPDLGRSSRKSGRSLRIRRPCLATIGRSAPNVQVGCPRVGQSWPIRRYVWKLLYAYMLGYEIDDTGHFQVDSEEQQSSQRSAASNRGVRAGRGVVLLPEVQREDGRARNSESQRKGHAAEAARRHPRYLATSLLLADNNDMVRMIVNSVKTDICSGNEAPTCRYCN